MSNLLSDEQLSELEYEIDNMPEIEVEWFDYYQYPRDETRLSEDVKNFYDPGLESILTESLDEKIASYEQTKKLLENMKTDFWIGWEKYAMHEYGDHEQFDLILRAGWNGIWKILSFDEIRKLKVLDQCIRNLKASIEESKKLKPEYKPKPVSKYKFTDEEIEEANSFPVANLAHGNSRFTGSKIILNCPFHKEKTGSFVIYPDNTWHCFGCSAHGTGAIDYIKRRDGIKFPEAIKLLLGR